jgi:hypothetical protein
MSTGVQVKLAGNLINEALRAATISGISVPVQAADYAQGEICLNDILANLQTKQIHIWSETEAFLPLVTDQQEYILGIGGDHCFTSYVHTTSSTAVAATVSTLDVSSTAGMTNGDFIGIELSTGVRQWATISSVVDSNTITITPALTDSVVAGATIYTYTTKIDQPVRILDARASSGITDAEITTDQLARKDFYNQNIKTTSGITSNWYYSRQLSSGSLKIWPVASSCNQILRFTFIKPQYVPEGASESVQVPPEWYLALKWMLAAQLGMVYSISAERQAMCQQYADKYLADAMSTDIEFASFSICPV